MTAFLCLTPPSLSPEAWVEFVPFSPSGAYLPTFPLTSLIPNEQNPVISTRRLHSCAFAMAVRC